MQKNETINFGFLNPIQKQLENCFNHCYCSLFLILLSGYEARDCR